MKTLLLLRALGRGGAERQVVEIAGGLRGCGHDVAAAVFYGGGALEADLRATGTRLHVMGKAGRWDLAGLALGLARIRREERPDVIYSILTGPNLAGLLAKLRRPRVPVVWGLRNSDIVLRHYPLFYRAALETEARLSGFADAIIVNSQAGYLHSLAMGFPARRMTVIPNGVDVDRFRPDPDGRRRLRTQWGIAEDEMLIGLVARIVPMKNHASFLRAAATASAIRPQLRFVCVGEGPAQLQSVLRREVASLGLGDRVIWAGPRDDMPAVHSALDIACSSSAYGEGSSNALLEAMACGRLCVATDVGDAREILGEFGRIVPPRDPSAFARALVSLSDELGAPAGFHEGTRHRVRSTFHRDGMAKATERVLLMAMRGSQATFSAGISPRPHGGRVENRASPPDVPERRSKETMPATGREGSITKRTQTVPWTDEQIARFWDFELDTPHLHFARTAGSSIARRAARHLRHARVLDYGCGVGHLIPHILRYARAAAGCDVSEKSIMAANATMANLSGFRGVCPPEALMRLGSTFDVAMLTEVIEHLDDTELDRTFEHLDRLLRDRGILVITTPNAEELSAGYVYCPACTSVFHRHQHVRTWASDTLSAFLKARGYSILTLAETDFRDFRHLRRLYGWYTGKRHRPNLYCVAQKDPR